jgi:hypothetical protein
MTDPHIIVAEEHEDEKITEKGWWGKLIPFLLFYGFILVITISPVTPRLIPVMLSAPALMLIGMWIYLKFKAQEKLMLDPEREILRVTHRDGTTRTIPLQNIIKVRESRSKDPDYDDVFITYRKPNPHPLKKKGGCKVNVHNYANGYAMKYALKELASQYGWKLNY